jgi:hypothetical protein
MVKTYHFGGKTSGLAWPFGRDQTKTLGKSSDGLGIRGGCG